MALTEDVKCHTAQNLIMASGTRDAFSIEINSIELEEEVQLKSVTEQKQCSSMLEIK